jgi:hypothetical protein
MNVFDIELDEVPSYEELEGWPLSAKRLAVDYIKLKVLNEIISIQPKIHAIRFSGDYDHNQIKEKIDKFKTIKSEDRLFKIIALGKFKGVDLRISLYPRDHELFKSMINFTFKSYKHLFKLKEIFPGLMTSRTEYALDLKCKSPDSTRNLLKLFRRYLYIPKKSVTQFLHSDSQNSTYYIGNKMKRQQIADPDFDPDETLKGDFQFKVYERGKRLINPKKKKGWRRDSLDTVRIEYTAKIPDHHKKGPHFIIDFLEDCKFYSIMSVTCPQFLYHFLS